jgi:hypothetical protein
MKHGTNPFLQAILVLLVPLGTPRGATLQGEGLRKPGPLKPLRLFRCLVHGDCAFVAPRNPQFTRVIIRHHRQEACDAC